MPLFPRRFVAALLAISLCLFVWVPVGLAISPSELGSSPPQELIVDEADVFSRASRNELESKLKGLEDQRVDARLITLRRLDYGYSLKSFGEELMASWSGKRRGSPFIDFDRNTKQTCRASRRLCVAKSAAGVVTHEYGSDNDDPSTS
jgi:uncharacterized protein